MNIKKSDIKIYEMMSCFMGKSYKELSDMELNHFSLLAYDLHEEETKVEFYNPYYFYYNFSITTDWQLRYECLIKDKSLFIKSKPIQNKFIHEVKNLFINRKSTGIESLIYATQAWHLDKEEIDDNSNKLNDYMLFNND